MKKDRQEKQLAFQNQNRKNYFEGWYFKQVSSDESVILSLIPSMMRSKNKERAMLQIILAENIGGNWQILTDQLDFPISEFKPQDNPFSINVGGNTFSKEDLSLDVNADNIKISGNVFFEPFTTLPTTMVSPTIMGPFSYLPFMECIHGIVSLHHNLKGTLEINGRILSFDDGIGYIEKDWGQSFPKYYVWLQSNHFENRPSSLFFSWAHIPLGPFQFPGFICHLWVKEKHYRFATYNGATCKIEDITEDKISIILKKAHITLSIQAFIKVKGALAAPKHGEMDHQIKEGLAVTINFQLVNEKNKEIIEDSSSLSGVEIVRQLSKTR